MTEPLTPEEEAELRADVALGPEGRAEQIYGEDVLRLLATLDRERAAGVHLGDEGLRKALVNIRSHAHHAGYCAAGEPGGSEYCICGLTEALVESDAALAAQENPA